MIALPLLRDDRIRLIDRLQALFDFEKFFATYGWSDFLEKILPAACRFLEEVLPLACHSKRAERVKNLSQKAKLARRKSD